MATGKENDYHASVPMFGGWDDKGVGATDYSMVFSKARADRKHLKYDMPDLKAITHDGNVNGEYMNAKPHHHPHHNHHEDPYDHHHHHVMGKRKILTYMRCFRS